jgi:hypothetical protein
MAGGADFHVQVALVSRPGRKAIAACAHDANFFVRGMNGCLHIDQVLDSNLLILQE